MLLTLKYLEHHIPMEQAIGRGLELEADAVHVIDARPVGPDIRYRLVMVTRSGDADPDEAVPTSADASSEPANSSDPSD